MTNKDLLRIYDHSEHCRIGYCCYQDVGVSKYDLVELGSNHGIYGWNWTAYMDAHTNTLYVSCYRNVPARMVNK